MTSYPLNDSQVKLCKCSHTHLDIRVFSDSFQIVQDADAGSRTGMKSGEAFSGWDGKSVSMPWCQKS
jgi:hypothetical protein